MTDEDIWPTAAQREKSIAQAVALREQAAAAGLRFEAYLPPELAKWLLERIEQGIFHDPSEAVFALLAESKDLEPHADLRKEILGRRLDAAINDTRPFIPADEVINRLREKLAAPRPEPAAWIK